MKIGILGAMPEEISSIKSLMVIAEEVSIGGRKYIKVTINSIEVILTVSRWGKVAASSTVTTLIQMFGVSFVLFTGVAGAVHPDLNIGDIVIGDGHYQHDMDARPMCLKYQIPLTDKVLFQPRSDDVLAAEVSSHQFIQNMGEIVSSELLAKHSIFKPKVCRGIIASGDKFITDVSAHTDLSYEIDGRKTWAVEMEGAAVAQICDDNTIPYVIIRTISDKADAGAAIDFESFVIEIASFYSAGVVKAYFNRLVDLSLSTEHETRSAVPA